MLKFAAHLEMNFAKEASFRERWLTAGRFGFKACEFVWRTRDLNEALELKAQAPISIIALGGTTGFAAGNGRPVITRPEDREQLAADVETAIGYARELGCTNLIFVPGNQIEGWSLEKHRQEAVASLKSVAPILERAGVTALIEPLNSKVDHKGIYCDNSEEAFRIAEEVGSSHVKILYDVYHMQIMEGNIIGTIRSKHDLIGYYHIAKVPGRTEPTGGDLNYPAILEAIEQTGYTGFVGLEYRPSENDLQVLEQIKALYPQCFS